MAGGAVLADALADPGDEVVVERGSVAEDDEERHEAFGAGQRQVEHECVDDLVEGEDGAVDLARTHPDAAAVDRRVGAARDDRGAAVGDLDPVAVAPDAREHLEVALAVAAAVGVAPEVDRHRRHRLGDHELADLADQRLPLGAPRLELDPERAGLQLALVDGQRRDAADERGADVGAAGGREQPDVLVDRLVHPREPLGREWRPGRPDRAQLREVAALRGADARPSGSSR